MTNHDIPGPMAGMSLFRETVMSRIWPIALLLLAPIAFAKPDVADNVDGITIRGRLVFDGETIPVREPAKVEDRFKDCLANGPILMEIGVVDPKRSRRNGTRCLARSGGRRETGKSIVALREITRENRDGRLFDLLVRAATPSRFARSNAAMRNHDATRFHPMRRANQDHPNYSVIVPGPAKSFVLKADDADFSGVRDSSVDEGLGAGFRPSRTTIGDGWRTAGLRSSWPRPGEMRLIVVAGSAGWLGGAQAAERACDYDPGRLEDLDVGTLKRSLDSKSHRGARRQPANWVVSQPCGLTPAAALVSIARHHTTTTTFPSRSSRLAPRNSRNSGCAARRLRLNPDGTAPPGNYGLVAHLDHSTNPPSGWSPSRSTLALARADMRC